MKRLLPFLMLFLAVFSGCNDDDDDELLALAETQTLLQGEWRSAFVKTAEYNSDKSDFWSYSYPSTYFELIFSSKSVTFTDNRVPAKEVFSSTTEDLKLTRNSGKRYLTLRQVQYELIRLNQDSLIMKLTDYEVDQVVKEHTFNFAKVK